MPINHQTPDSDWRSKYTPTGSAWSRNNGWEKKEGSLLLLMAKPKRIRKIQQKREGERSFQPLPGLPPFLFIYLWKEGRRVTEAALTHRTRWEPSSRLRYKRDGLGGYWARPAAGPELCGAPISGARRGGLTAAAAAAAAKQQKSRSSRCNKSYRRDRPSPLLLAKGAWGKRRGRSGRERLRQVPGSSEGKTSGAADSCCLAERRVAPFRTALLPPTRAAAFKLW